MSAQDIATIEEFYAALNRNDIESALSFFAPSAWRSEFLETPNGGTYRGIEALATHFRTARATWAEGACTPEGFFPNGDKVVVDVHVRVRLKDREDWLEGRVADAFELHTGKFTEFHSFSAKSKAFEWAGIQDGE